LVKKKKGKNYFVVYDYIMETNYVKKYIYKNKKGQWEDQTEKVSINMMVFLFNKYQVLVG